MNVERQIAAIPEMDQGKRNALATNARVTAHVAGFR